MTRAEVYDFVKSGINKLKPTHDNGRGRISELSSEAARSKVQLPFVWYETIEDQAHVNTELAPTTYLPIDGWSIRLHVVKKSPVDADSETYEQIVDECDAVAQTLQFLYNQVVAGSNELTIIDLSRSSFINRHSDNMTGVILSFNLRVPDLTDQSENCE